MADRLVPPAGVHSRLDGLVRVGERTLTAGEAERLNRLGLLDRVVPNVAHEINNALQVVSGLAELLAARQDLPAPVADKIARMGAQATRASAMLRDLVVFVRPEASDLRIVDLAGIAEAALALRRYHLARAQVAVTVNAVPGSCLVRARPDALMQAVLNLLVNAEQAIAGGLGAALSVEVVAEDATTCHLAVTDSGAAAGSRDAARAASGNASRGPGLGLPVAVALVAAAGGTLRLEEAGLGTRAVMTLPRTPPPRG